MKIELFDGRVIYGDVIVTIKDELHIDGIAYNLSDIKRIDHFDEDYKRFETHEEAIYYAQKNFESKYDWEKVIIDNRCQEILCCTNLVYEDLFYGFANELVEKFDFEDIEIAELRDEFIKAFEKKTGFSFLDGYSEY